MEIGWALGVLLDFIVCISLEMVIPRPLPPIWYEKLPFGRPEDFSMIIGVLYILTLTLNQLEEPDIVMEPDPKKKNEITFGSLSIAIFFDPVPTCNQKKIYIWQFVEKESKVCFHPRDVFIWNKRAPLTSPPFAVQNGTAVAS